MIGRLSMLCLLLTPLPQSCAANVVRVWSDAGGSGSNRNITDIHAHLQDLRNDRYDVIVNETYLGGENGSPGTISAVANFSNEWVVFGTSQEGFFGHGLTVCIAPLTYIPNLTDFHGRTQYCTFLPDHEIICTGVATYDKYHMNMNDTFQSYLGTKAANEVETGCDVVIPQE